MNRPFRRVESIVVLLAMRLDLRIQGEVLRVDVRIMFSLLFLLVRKRHLLPKLCLHTGIPKLLANVMAFSLRKALE